MIINSVITGGGTQPTGTKNITANGVYDVTDFASADVQVPTTAPAYYIEKTKDANGVAQNSSYLMDLSTFTDVGVYVFAYAYHRNISITGAVDLSSLTTISGTFGCYNMFTGCTGLTTIDLSSLTTVSGASGCYNMFQSCSGITGALDLSSLAIINANSGCNGMFSSCTGITSVDLSSLTTVSSNSGCYNMFQSCTRLASVDLSSLATITGSSAYRSIFSYCTSLTSLSFPALTRTSFGGSTNQFNNMLQAVTGCTVHFPSNLQSVIGSWSDVTNGFGGTNTTVLFDLPATVTLTGADTVTYTRNPKYDTATALAWKVGAYGTTNFTPAYYTSGTTDPAVSNTIYSDSACTTPVTTISSIA